MKEVGVFEDICVCDFIEEEFGKICDVIDKLKVEGDFCCEVFFNIKCLIEIGSYCGICYCRGLFVCG